LEWESPILCLFGPSGSGKSTVIEAIAGLRPEVTGEINVAGQFLQGASEWLAPDKRRVGWVPQDGSLFPHLSVEENVYFGANSAHEPSAPLEQILDVLDLQPLLSRTIDGLSGGEKQRVAVARALMAGARILLLDEPLAALDHALKSRVLALFLRIRDELGVPIIYVSHDPIEVRALNAELAVLKDGRVIAQGGTEQVFGDAGVLTVLESMGVENVFEADVVPNGDGMLCATTSGGTALLLPTPSKLASAAIRLAVRAEDILISLNELQQVSARNCLSGEIIELQDEASGIWVKVRVSNDTWIVRVTRSAGAELDLRPGQEIWLTIKASAIHVIEPA